MAVVIAIFATHEDITNPGFDGRVVRFPVGLVPEEYIRTPRQMQNTRNICIRLQVSGSLLACWQLAEVQLIKALYHIAREHLESRLSQGSIADELVVPVNTHTQPLHCTFDLDHIDFDGQAVVALEIRRPIGFVWSDG